MERKVAFKYRGKTVHYSNNLKKGAVTLNLIMGRKKFIYWANNKKDLERAVSIAKKYIDKLNKPINAQ